MNGLLGLVRPDGLYPSPLHDAGFELAGLEIPVATAVGTAVVDALLYHPATNLLVPCEVKSGANVEDAQARRYAAIDAASLVQAAQLTIRQLGRPTVSVLYVCAGEHLDRIRLGLSQAEVDFAILTVGPEMAALHPVAALPQPLHDAALPMPLLLPPPKIISFDHESADDAVRPAVRAELVAELAHRRTQMSVPYLAERAAPNLVLYGRQAKKQLVKRVADVARHIASEDPETFAFVPAPPNGDAMVKLLRTPEDNDPRGRTQAYQALSRSVVRGRRSSRPSDPDQLNLLEVLQAGDDDESDAPETGEEAGS